jgi:hypothetical protein
MAKVPLAFKRVGIDFTVSDSVQSHELGIEIPSVDGKTYKYIRAGGSIAVGSALQVDTAEGPNDFIPTSAVKQPVVGVAEVAIADNEFGWVVTKGNVVTKLAGSTAAGAVLGSSGTAGTLATLTVSSDPSQAEVQAILAQACGKAAQCVVAESGGTGTVKLS